ncbi:MAG: DMT family transporter [Bacillota bacterium]
MESRSTAYGYLLVAISSIGFGTLGLWGKWGYQAGFTPESLLVLRFGIASISLWAVLLLKQRRFPWPGKRAAVAFIFQGAVFYALTALCFFEALSLLPAGLASMLFYLHPVMTTILAGWLWHERISRPQILALAVAFVGTALLAGEAFSGQLSLLGVLLTLMGAAAYSGFTLVGQSTGHLAKPLVACTYSTTACFLSLLLWARPSLSWLASLSWKQWLIGFGVAQAATVIGILFFLSGVAIIGASRTAIIAALEPASAVVFSALLLGEQMTANQLLGVVAILGSICILFVLGRAGQEQSTSQAITAKPDKNVTG